MVRYYPGLFEDAGPKCEYLGWCPEHNGCGKYPSREDVLIIPKKQMKDLIIDEKNKISKIITKTVSDQLKDEIDQKIKSVQSECERYISEVNEHYSKFDEIITQICEAYETTIKNMIEFIKENNSDFYNNEFCKQFENVIDKYNNDNTCTE